MLKKVLINNTMFACVSDDGIETLGDIFDKIELVDEVRIDNGIFVYWPYDNDLKYIKAFVNAEHADKFIRNGAALTMFPDKSDKLIPDTESNVDTLLDPELIPEPMIDDIEDNEPEDEFIKPDETGSTPIDAINDFDSNRDIVDYVKDLTGEIINHRGKIEYVKQNAIKAIEKWQRQQDK